VNNTARLLQLMKQQSHNNFLDAIVENVSLINEDRRKLIWIGKEISYFKPSNRIARLGDNQYPMCDLAMEFDDHLTLCEVKSYAGKKHSRKYALTQLYYGRDWVHQVKGWKHEPWMTIAWYDFEQGWIKPEIIWRPYRN
jgi:hypothetical protein